MIMSLARPTTVKLPSGACCARSPLWKKPSASVAVRSGQ